MSDKFDKMENSEYVELVLLPELLIKLYMIFFKLQDKIEAEKCIKMTSFDDENLNAFEF